MDTAVDSTVLKVDRNYTHSVWLSYMEVYNEKVYDLLADTSSLKTGTKAGPSALLLARKAMAIKPSPPSDWEGSQNTGKYAAGLRQIRVHSAAQAKEILKLGQLHRKVFGTLANSQSSRSHALVTVKLLRCNRGDYHVHHHVYQALIRARADSKCFRTPQTYKLQGLHWWISQVRNVRKTHIHQGIA